MFCKNCGHNMKEGAGFCKNCGQVVKRPDTNITDTPGTNTGDSVLTHKNRNVFLLVLAVVILISAVAYYGFFYSKKSDYEAFKADNSNPILSVVNIVCISKNGESMGGSGTIIREDGLILTNAHVIPQTGETPSVEGDRCLVAIPDEFTGQPKEIYYAEPQITKDLSKKYDIATMQIVDVYVDDKGNSWGTFPNTFKQFDESSSCKGDYIQLGDPVRIYGYPVTSGGYNLTITEGIVSSFNDDGTILTSAKIDSGNSGGLAMDGEGCFIGIPSAVTEGNYENLGVIIPPDLIREFGDELENFDVSKEEPYNTPQDTTKPKVSPRDSSTSTTNDWHSLEDIWNGTPPPKWGEGTNLTINTVVPYYYNHGDVFIKSGTDYGWNDDRSYSKVSGDLNIYKQGAYPSSAYDGLQVKVYNPAFPRYEYTGLAQTITGYVIIPAGATGNNEDLYVKEPGSLLEYKKKNNWFNKAGIKITLQNSRFSSSGYLINSNDTGAYYYVGSLLPDTYNVIVTLPAGWKLSSRKSNPSSVTIPYVRKNTYGDNSLWIYIEPK